MAAAARPIYSMDLRTHISQPLDQKSGRPNRYDTMPYPGRVLERSSSVGPAVRDFMS